MRSWCTPLLSLVASRWILNWDEDCLRKFHDRPEELELNKIVAAVLDKNMHGLSNPQQTAAEDITRTRRLSAGQGAGTSTTAQPLAHIVSKLRISRSQRHGNRSSFALNERHAVDSARDAILGEVLFYSHALVGETDEFPDYALPAYLGELTDDILPDSGISDTAQSLAGVIPCVNSIDRPLQRLASKPQPTPSQRPSIFDMVVANSPDDWKVEASKYSDPWAKYQWYLGSGVGMNWVNAWKLWDEEKTADSLDTVRVAVVDAECSLHNPSLQYFNTSDCADIEGREGDNCMGYDFGRDDHDTSFDGQTNIHGTAVASLIVSKTGDDLGIVGACRQCRLVCLKVVGELGLDSEYLLKAYDWLLTQPEIKISNHSYGGFGYIRSEHDALRKLDQSGHILVFAAGNEGCDQDSISSACEFVAPAMYDLIHSITVSGTDIWGRMPRWSNFGRRITDVFAPGDYIAGLCENESDAVALWQGTSFSAPLVTAAIATAMALRPNTSPLRLKELLMATTDWLRLKAAGGRAGAVNVHRFLDAVVHGLDMGTESDSDAMTPKSTTPIDGSSVSMPMLASVLVLVRRMDLEYAWTNLGSVVTSLTKAVREGAQEMIAPPTPLQRTLKEAINEDNWGCSSTVLAECARATHGGVSYRQVMDAVWAGLEHKSWRMKLKALTLLEYIIKSGNDTCADEARDSSYCVVPLKGYRCIDNDGKDKGAMIRQLAGDILTMLHDKKVLKAKREEAKQAREKYIGISSSGQINAAESAPLRGAGHMSSPFEEYYGPNSGIRISQLQFRKASDSTSESHWSRRASSLTQESVDIPVTRATKKNQETLSATTTDLLHTDDPFQSAPFASSEATPSHAILLDFADFSSPAFPVAAKAVTDDLFGEDPFVSPDGEAANPLSEPTNPSTTSLLDLDFRPEADRPTKDNLQTCDLL
ncbi:MAG: uncharacterized protein KVP18_002895 [Porospora cf. gigantea A]|uniref:uncharacterized protein n=1 Tax=Porospora cf. gigantea A TaxID=2853593 RepID=UPI00355A35BE|nr:MAG: hypothetical protein KVP18_002895 [Porospora cf. gigantea A]